MRLIWQLTIVLLSSAGCAALLLFGGIIRSDATRRTTVTAVASSVTTEIPTPLPLEEVQSDAPADNITQLLETAITHERAGALREAEIVLTRAIAIEKNGITALRRLAAVQRRQAELSCQNSDFLACGRALDRAGRSLEAIEKIAVDPTATMEASDVTDEERSYNTTASKVRAQMEAFCQREIKAAEAAAEKAHHFIWRRNDREVVVEGLTHLATVFSLKDWIGRDTRVAALRAMSELKKRVYDEEWDDLQTRAGIDVTTPK